MAEHDCTRTYEYCTSTGLYLTIELLPDYQIHPLNHPTSHVLVRGQDTSTKWIEVNVGQAYTVDLCRSARSSNFGESKVS